MTSEFEAFWQVYPRRIGRLVAEAKYAKARKIASAEEILAGVARYLANKPEYADWAHPKTWLSQGRWMDEYGPVQKKARIAEQHSGSSGDWFDECKSIHGGNCGLDRHRHGMRMQAEKQAGAA